MFPTPSAALAPERLVVLVPVYRPRLEPLEQFSLAHSLAQLRPGRRVCWLAPRSLDLAAYELDFPGHEALRFDDPFFASIKGYNRLLLDADFYDRFAAEHGFQLILQTDAILLRDELDAWMDRGHDYVGAPWPQPLEIDVRLDRYAAPGQARRVRAQVGNGGLSLRRNAACAALLREFPQARQVFLASGSSEDLFFAFLGAVSAAFRMPAEAEAARFALELDARRFHYLNGGQPPMGGHAWWKYDPQYWLEQLGAAGEAARRLLPSAATAPVSAGAVVLRRTPVPLAA
jgi:hypothetical protein